MTDPTPGADERTTTSPPLADLRNAIDFGPAEGERFERFRVIRKLGEGGMGVVFEAEQETPVRRRVALKLIKLGMDTKEVLARFESERQALALLNHPNIAQVYDAGHTPDGRPYFAMELVSGVPIDIYCERERLPIAARLKLVRAVCDGMQHAHQKGILHRDIKPSNIIVVDRDGTPVPKIIDFGVAKAIGQSLTEQTLATELGQLVGTPAYMSPEQVVLASLDVDTRADVYALGALLYGLLTGSRPFDAAGSRRLSVLELLEAIRKVDPPLPSVRVQGLGPVEAERLAHQFRVDVRTLAGSLRGDLDWIVVRTMEKDRDRRYGSAEELAADIDRYMRHEPVYASPPSRIYRLRKFVRRHRVGVLATASLALALVMGMVGTTTGLVRALRAERQAREEAETARQVTDFLTGIFQVSDPSEARGNTITAREILDKGAERIDRELSGSPLVKARLMDAVSGVYRNLGLYVRAIPLARGALAIRERERGGWSREVASSLNRLGELMTLQFRYQDALPLHERAMRIRRRIGDLRSTDAAWSMYHLGANLAGMGRFDQGKALLDSALVIFRREPGRNDVAVAWCLNELAIGHCLAGRYAEAEPLFREAVALKRKTLGPDHPDVAAGLSNLGYVVSILGRPADAKRLIQQALEITERTAGPTHQNTGSYLGALGEAEIALGQYDSARVHMERALAIAEHGPGGNLRQAAANCQGLAQLYAKTGRVSLAEHFYRRSLSYWERDSRVSGTGYPDFLDEYSKFLSENGRRGEAAKMDSKAKLMREADSRGAAAR